MLAVFIHSLEIALLSLLAVLAYRVHYLYLETNTAGSDSLNTVLKRLIQGETAHSNEYEIKMECLKKAQAFSGIQLLEIKRNYGDLKQKNLEWLREAICLYLIGAIDLIGKEAKCGARGRKELVTLVLKSNLNLSTESTYRYYQEALYRKLSSDNDLMVRAGAKAAKNWLSNSTIPKEMSLSTQLDEWGIFA